MKLPTGPSSNHEPAAVPFTYTCPYLGMVDDRTTVTLFPSQDNLCFRCQSPTAPNAAHQSGYCLSQKFTSCILKQQDGPGNLPAASRWPADPAISRAAWLRTAAGLGIALLLALFFILWLPGIISDVMMNFAPTPVSGGNWPTLTPSPAVEYTAASLTEALAPANFASPSDFSERDNDPTATATSEPTPTPQVVKLIVAEADFGVNCHTGPDISLPSLTVLRTGDALTPLGRDPGNIFFAVSIPEKNIDECWVVQVFVDVEGDPAALPALTPAP